MTHITLILGEVGSGKSTSVRNLPAEETFLISISKKPMPFPEFNSKYYQKKLDQDGNEVMGNYIYTDNKETIRSILDSIDKKRPQINTIIIDDFQYFMSNEFFKRSSEKGFQKFTDIGYMVWALFNEIEALRSDLNVFILSHSELKDDGAVRLKTVGKLVDEKSAPEGRAFCIFHAISEDGQHKFLTQRRGNLIARTPIGMFNELVIDNDLLLVKKKINDYLNKDINF